MRKNLACCLVAAISLALSPVSGAWAAVSWQQPYSHYSDREPLSSVLTDFARCYGLNAQLSGAVSGTVSGRFAGVTPSDFLSAMHTAYGVRYYISGNTIYFYHDSEQKRVVYRPSSVSTRSLMQQLQHSGLVASQLPLSVNSQGLMVVQGPQAYVDALLLSVRELERQQEQQVVMEVFKLKHAKAQDLQITSMDKTVNIPGIASILQAMTGTGDVTGGALSVTVQSPAVQSLRGQGLSSFGTGGGNNGTAGGSASGLNNAASGANVNITATASPSAASAAGSGGMVPDFQPNIIADSRLNAVVIQDFKYRMPYYRQVISELDVPLRLVELHAAIVDIDVDATKDLGIDWQGGRREGNWSIAGGVGQPSWDGSTFPVQVQGNGGIFSTVFATNHSRFMAQVQALEEDNKARTLGRPSVLTLDNVEATLENTTTRYIPVRGYESSDLFKVESGTVLRVTPHIVEDPQGGAPFIQMVISLQSNQDNDANTSDLVGGNGEVYVAPISQTKINTQALVREGQSLLLGGYFVQNDTRGDSGVPGLKDAKVVGGLFGTENNSSYTRERLLLITPRVLSADALNVPAGIDEPTFVKSPTQADYERRTVIPAKAEESGGCSSSRATGPAEPQQVQGQPQVQPVSQPALAPELSHSGA